MSYQAGGRITIDVGGTKYSPRGKATIDAAGLENAMNENHDGTVSRSTKSKACTAVITLDRGRASNGTERPKYDEAFMQGFYDITIRETDVRVMHLFTQAFLVGTPKQDTETGEIADLTVCCPAANYSQVSY